MIIYIVDNILNIIYKGKVISKTFKDSVSKGYVINRELFIRDFSLILKKEKIKSKLLSDKIIIVNNAFYRNSDLFMLEHIFNELGYVKIQFWDIRELLKKDYNYIEINNTYMVLYLEKAIYLDLDYFKDIPKIIDYFKDYLSKDIIVFGGYKYLLDLVKNRNFYYFENYKSYITDSLLKVNKTGV